MVYDCFTFFNELDLLELRLETLNPVVDRFVLAEADRTYGGKPKELLFEKHRARFAKYLDKIVHVAVLDLLPEEEIAADPFNLRWVNENRQRNALAQGLADAADSDIAIVSDLDEIPRPEMVAKAKVLLAEGRAECVRFEMEMFNYHLNLKDYFNSKWLLGSIATRCATFRAESGVLAGVACSRFLQASENAGNTPNKLRFRNADCTLSRAGWHFTYLGGAEAVKYKIKSFSHSEFSGLPDEMVEKRLRDGTGLYDGMRKLFAVEVDETFPRPVRDDPGRWAEFLLPVDRAGLRAARFARWRVALCGKLYRLAVRLTPGWLAGPAQKLKEMLRRTTWR